MALKVGDKVKVADGREHDEMTKGAKGEIVHVSLFPALGIKFKGMDGMHKWYTEPELEKVED